MAALLLVSAGLNLFDLHQLRAVRAHSELQPGATPPAIAASTLDGRLTIMPVSGSLPTMLYIFIPECAWCERNKGTR